MVVGARQLHRLASQLVQLHLGIVARKEPGALPPLMVVHRSSSPPIDKGAYPAERAQPIEGPIGVIHFHEAADEISPWSRLATAVAQMKS